MVTLRAPNVVDPSPAMCINASNDVEGRDRETVRPTSIRLPLMLTCRLADRCLLQRMKRCSSSSTKDALLVTRFGCPPSPCLLRSMPSIVKVWVLGGE